MAVPDAPTNLRIFTGSMYYVSKSGTDDGDHGSSPGAGAYLTIGYAISQNVLVGGDIVYIEGGTYTEHITLTSSDSGSSGNYVTFKSYLNDDVIIQWNTSSDEVIKFYDATGWTQYIKFDGSGADSGHHIRITTTTSYRCIHMIYSRYIWLTHCEIDNAQSYDNIKLRSKAVGTDSGGEDDDTGSRNCIIEYCNIHDGGDYGIKITGWGTDNNIVRYNNIYNNGGHGADNFGINLSGSGYAANPPTGNQIYNNDIYSNYSNGINILYATDTIFRDNTVRLNGTGESSGKGISVSTSSTGTILYNNIIYGNAYYGLHFYNPDDAKAYNNLIYDNQKSAIAEEVNIATGASNCEFYNNTVYNLQTQAFNNYAMYVKQSTNTDSVHYIKNNIMVSSGNYAFRSDENDSGDLVFANNDCYSAGATPYYADSGYRNVAYINGTWLPAKDNGGGNITEDPIIDASYDLTASSPQGSGHVRDGGLDLTSEGFTTDRHGTSRDQTWDMGCDEYTA